MEIEDKSFKNGELGHGNRGCGTLHHRLDAGSTGPQAEVVQAALEQAVALYRGDLLPACYDDWLLLERERLRQEYVKALEQLICLLSAAA